MAVTFLQAVNRTLVKLRESEVTTLSGASDYVKLVASFVNETVQDISNTWDWNALRASVTITTVAGTSTYSLTGMGEDFSIESILDETNNLEIVLNNRKTEDINRIVGSMADSNAQPIYANVEGVDSSGDIQLRFTPPPDGAYTITVYGKKKPAYLETASDDSTIIKLPWLPVMYGAYLKALSERGEDGGAVFDEANAQYMNALSDAIAIDALNNHKNLTWYED